MVTPNVTVIHQRDRRRKSSPAPHTHRIDRKDDLNISECYATERGLQSRGPLAFQVSRVIPSGLLFQPNLALLKTTKLLNLRIHPMKLSSRFNRFRRSVGVGGSRAIATDNPAIFHSRHRRGSLGAEFAATIGFANSGANAAPRGRNASSKTRRLSSSSVIPSRRAGATTWAAVFPA
jgi:hypothetical protein